MSEPFDPSMLGDGVDTSDAPARSSLDNAISSTRALWTGLDDLPVDEPPLDDSAAVDATAETTAGAGTPALPAQDSPAAPVAAEPDPALAALHQELALLRAELASRATSAPTPTSVAPPVPVVSDDAITRAADRFKHTFDAIEGMEAGTTEYADARARAFAQTIVQAVLEDILPQEATRSYIRQEAAPVARELVAQQEQLRRDQSASETIISQAVKAARDAGYDVHSPSDAGHLASRESVTFWALAQALSQPGRTASDEITATLAMMPPRSAALPAAAGGAPARPQPMARQGAGTPTGMAGPADSGPYQAQSIGSILSAQQRIQRIGAA